MFRRGTSGWISYGFMGIVLICLYFTTFVDYLLFHSLAEFFSIAVAFSFFSIAWNSRRFIENKYLLFIGLAYLFIAFLDVLHTLSYQGMAIFQDYDFYANQLWIAARYMESLTLLAAFYFLGAQRSFKPETIFAVYAAITLFLIMSIFVWKIFPICFVEGAGLTPFKKISEYIICLILLSCMVLLYRRREHFAPHIHRLLFFSLFCTIVSELAFTFYVSNYGISNLVGHYFKIFSFYAIYKAVIETGIRNPYDLIFKEITSANSLLEKEIQARRLSEKEREALIENLQTALSQVKKLSGLLPICSHCKKVRDDQGNWGDIDAYIARHTEAVPSHGICRECAAKHYPGYKIYDD